MDALTISELVTRVLVLTLGFSLNIGMIFSKFETIYKIRNLRVLPF